MVLLLLFFALFCIAEGCAPGASQATITLYTEETYNPNENSFYKDHATKLIKEALAKYGIHNADSYFAVSPRSSFGRVAIDVNVLAGVDCNTLPRFVNEMITQNLLVTSAGIKCGNNPFIAVS
ncbi:hypothetical protein Aduo_007696 [Ancylostoma duodenale]